MPVKLTSGGKVILKNGKVSCTCCVAPEGCCMYPAAALVAGFYTYEDLPDAIIINEVEFTKLDPPEFVGGVTNYYINANLEYVWIEDQGEDSVWSSEGTGGLQCLITPGISEDQFADSYTITGVGVAERQSLCVWQYTPESESPWIIEYGYPGYEYKWTIQSTSIGLYVKANPQNSPAGTYGPGLVVS